MNEPFPWRRIGPLRVAALSAQQAIALIDERAVSNHHVLIAFANTNLVNWAARDPSARAALDDFLILNDGIGVEVAARIVGGGGFPENLSGTDFVPLYLQASERAVRVFLVGSTTKSVEGAARYFQAECGVSIVGARDGYSIWADETGLIQEINASQPDVLLVAFGNPKQELWIHKRAGDLSASAIFAVGALLDFVSGEKMRCPLWMRRLKIEWFHRLLSEPRRLGRRYTVDLAEFFYYILVKHR